MAVAIVMAQAAEPAVDLATVSSRAKARVLAMRGALVQTWLVPRDLGGSADRVNELFVPPEAARRIAAVTARLMLLAVGGGRRRTLTVVPTYRGASIVPASITYVVHPDEERVTVPIW
ncbi:hypothetical protein [Sphingomonas sp. RIT328]|uniref:hypothetical protein n=1 Tax=Sphingomonas sp. RIT328 TaxID=1470591 RepID=UPI0004459744|nr:hypothetical protein [Sphingomonas sp. RIT328]EZP49253.1 hypothetical protein BW41_03534 [Sphingomonas sp. RIT328]